MRPSDRPSQYRGGLVGAVARFFWGQPTPLGERRMKLHLPIASDIASTSADLLFSEPVILTAAEDQQATTTQDRLDELAEALHAPLLEAAEVSAGLGGVYLRAVWDKAVQPDGPWVSPVHADAAIPEWAYGMLRAVTFWRVLVNENARVVRHLERHEPGVIEHAVYEGTADRLGRAVPLKGFAETAGLVEALNADGVIETGTELLTAAYVPNMRPNRLWRSLPGACHLGRSDYSGSESLMDALDETWSSWMRDLRLGKGRVMLPEYMLQRGGVGQGAYFDTEQEYYAPLTMAPNVTGPQQITPQQFAIRVTEHRDTALELMARIVGAAGYSGQTFGLTGDVALTATEVAARERKSLITRDKKGLYWRPAVAHMVQVLQQLGNAHFGWGVSAERPTAQLPDAVQPDQRSVAETADLLNRAIAASIETRVKLVHPDWDDEQVQAEVERIKDEQGVGVAAADAFGTSDEGDERPPDGEDEQQS